MINGNYSQPATYKSGRSGRQRRPFVEWVRIAMTLVLVGAACYLAFGFGSLLAEWRGGTTGNASNEAERSLAGAGAFLPLAGQWSFAEFDWNLRSEVIPQSQVDRRLAAAVQSIPAEQEPLLQTVSPEILEVLEALQISSTRHADYQLYAANRDDLKARLITREIQGSLKAAALLVAYPNHDGQWQLLDFRPAAEAPRTRASAQFLLPLPGEPRRTGGRYADNGEALLELVSLDSNGAEIIAHWVSRGWQARPSGIGDPDAFSYLCAKGDVVIYAWSADDPADLRNLMLVRAPSDSMTDSPARSP